MKELLTQAERKHLIQTEKKLIDFHKYLPIMQIETTLTYHNKTLIIEAKFYSRTLQRYYQSQTIHSHYSPDISYQMGDNTISVKPLDLHRDFIHIANQLDEIVEFLTPTEKNTTFCDHLL